MRSVALGFWIGTGSRGEDDEQAGSRTCSSTCCSAGPTATGRWRSTRSSTPMGAELNAGTGKETTSVYSRVLDAHLHRAPSTSWPTWSGGPRFADVDTEREVVLEEIAMYEDDPQDKVFDVLGEAVFGDHPLGRADHRPREVIARTPVDAIRAFHAARYVARNIVVAAAGSIDHDALVELPAAARAAGRPRPRAPAPTARRRAGATAVRFERKDTEQYHVCLGAPGHRPRRRAPLRPARARQRPRRHIVLTAVPGGARAARPGLRVYSFTSQYAGAGQSASTWARAPYNLGAGAAMCRRRARAAAPRSRSPPRSSARSKENVKGRARARRWSPPPRA